jgi:hypothetical protein
MNLFAPAQIVILIQLLIAHVLADFFLQPNSWVQEKHSKGLRSFAFYKHGLVVAVSAWIAINKYLAVAIVITFVHLVIDFLKIKVDKNGDIKVFLVEEALHVLTITAAWLYIISGWRQITEGAVSLWSSLQVTTILLGYLICVGPVSNVIKFSTLGWVPRVLMIT